MTSARGRTTSTASAMSLSMASMSIGSGTSSQWLAGVANAPYPMALDDGGSVLSEMSSDLKALDLADSRL